MPFTCSRRCPGSYPMSFVIWSPSVACKLLKSYLSNRRTDESIRAQTLPLLGILVAACAGCCVMSNSILVDGLLLLGDSANLRSGSADCSPNYPSCHLSEDRSSRFPWAHLPSSGPLALADRAHIFIKPFTPVPLFHRSNIPLLPEHPLRLIAAFRKPWKTDD